MAHFLEGVTMIYDELKLNQMLNTLNIDENTYEVQKNNNQFTIRVKQHNSSYYLHSKYNPVKQGLEFAKAKFELHEHIVLYGLGLGYHVVPIIEEVIKQQKRLYIFEFNLELLKLAFEYTDIKDYLQHENIILYALDCISEAAAVMKEVFSKQDVYVITYEPCLRAIPIHMEKIKVLFEKYLMDMKSAVAQQDNIVDNKQYNEKRNYPNAGILFKDKLKDIPCIIVSAGHSLKENIEQLKKAYNKAIIIAIGRVSAELRQFDISPDFYIEGSNKDFTLNHLSSAEPGIPLLMLNTANKNLENYGGFKFLLYTDCKTEQDKQYLVEYGGSVATLATSFAKLAGCSPIVYVGQDLCYTSEFTHNNEDTKVIETRGGLYVDGIDGNQYFTTKQLYLFKVWIENFIEKHKETKFINSTAVGANIIGAENININGVLASLPEFKTNIYYDLMEIVYSAYGKSINDELLKEYCFDIKITV